MFRRLVGSVARGVVLVAALAGGSAASAGAPAPGSRYVGPGSDQLTVLSDSEMEVTVGPEIYIGTFRREGDLWRLVLPTGDSKRVRYFRESAAGLTDVRSGEVFRPGGGELRAFVPAGGARPAPELPSSPVSPALPPFPSPGARVAAGTTSPSPTVVATTRPEPSIPAVAGTAASPVPGFPRLDEVSWSSYRRQKLEHFQDQRTRLAWVVDGLANRLKAKDPSMAPKIDEILKKLHTEMREDDELSGEELDRVLHETVEMVGAMHVYQAAGENMDRLDVVDMTDAELDLLVPIAMPAIRLSMRPYMEELVRFSQDLATRGPVRHATQRDMMEEFERERVDAVNRPGLRVKLKFYEKWTDKISRWITRNCGS